MQRRLSDHKTTEGNVPSSEKKNNDVSSLDGQLDSGIVDSGFLSTGANSLLSGEFGLITEDACDGNSSEDREQRKISTNFVDRSSKRSSANSRNEAVEPEPMRADSGLDLGLGESLSRLSLRAINLNPLDSGKVQCEPTVELRPLKIRGSRNHENTEREKQQNQRQYTRVQEYKRKTWELYYSQNDDGDTQLHIAIIQGFLESAYSLIRMAPHPCLLNILNDDCQAPLHLAILTGQSRIARRLILAGADPSIRDFRGNTPLHLACFSGDIACARALTDPLSPVEKKYFANSTRIPVLPQNLELRNYHGETCLHVATSGGQVDLVQHLFRLGADLESREGLAGRTSLHLALEQGCRPIVTFLLQECRLSLDVPTYAGITAYRIAACFDSQLARELVRLGAEPLPEMDSEVSDDSGDEGTSYMPALARLRQRVGVRA